jgi:cytochrome c556
LCASLLLLAGFAVAQKPHLVLFPMMRGDMVVDAERLGVLGEQARDADGMPDGSKLSPSDWTHIWKSADRLAQAASDLASSATIDVVGTDAKVESAEAIWGSTPAEIKHYIDQDRPGFDDRARNLGALADQFKRAANRHDADLLIDAADRLENVCEACHLRYWYPAPKPGG